MKKPIRTFIAIELNSEIRQNIFNLLEDLKKIDCHVKWVLPENFHITLKFLGDVSLDKINAIQKNLNPSFADFKPFSMKLTEFGIFPNWKRPRVLWVGIEDQQKNFQNLSKIIEDKLNPLGFKKEERIFHPHITLARIKSFKNISLLSQKISDIIFKNNLRQSINYIALFQSILTTSGPEYTLIKKINLGG